MKLILLIIVIVLGSGCTSLTPVEMSPEQLHERIAVGDVVQVGSSVRIVTADGIDHKFKVTAISDERILGKDVEVNITDIVALETREFSAGKTTVLAGSSALVAILALMAASLTLGN